MTTGSVARRYAKALYELAAEARSTEATGLILRQIAEAVDEAGRASFARGVLQAGARRQIGETIAQKVGGPDSLIGRFVRLVAERDRLADLDSIAEWYAKLEDQAAGRVRVAITSPVALSDTDVAAICKAFRGIAGGEVVASVNTDASILGGAIVELQGRVFDGSVKSALARLASRMAGTMDGAGPRAGTGIREGKGNADQSL